MSRSVTGGKWKSAVRKWAEGLLRHVEDRSSEPLLAIGNEFQKRVQQIITSGSAGGPPLSSSTVRTKGHSVKLVDTGDYAASIEVRVARYKGTRTIKVMVEPSNADMAMLAKIHEYGTSHVPARPHWRIAMADVKNMPATRAFLKGKWLRFKG